MKPQMWEYFSFAWRPYETENVDIRLTDYGKAGWELVSVVSSVDFENYVIYRAFFKRPLTLD